MIMNLKRFSIYLSLLLCIILGGCGSECSETALQIDKFSEGTIDSLKNFINKIEKKESINSNLNADKVDFYVDVSRGGNDVGVKESQAILNLILTEITPAKPSYYKVGEYKKPEPFSELNNKNGTEIENYLIDYNNYRGLQSRLDVAIDAITQNPDNVSLFISDFLLDKGNCMDEEGKSYGNEIRAWAKEQFTSWLSAGHKIDIIAKKYINDKQHGNKKGESYMYFLFFTPKELINKETRTNKLLEKLRSKANGNDIFAFAFRTDDKTIEKKYSNADGGGDLTGGYGNYSPLNEVSDFYSFTISDLIDQEIILSGKQQKILSNLILRNGLKYFPDITLDAQEFDITESYLNYSCSSVAPEINAGSKSSMFIFNQSDTLSLSFNNISKTSIATSHLYRIVIKIKASSYKDDQEQLKPLSWTHLCKTKNVENSALMKSITYALEHIDETLKEQKLFSYYILLNP